MFIVNELPEEAARQIAQKSSSAHASSQVFLLC